MQARERKQQRSKRNTFLKSDIHNPFKPVLSCDHSQKFILLLITV